MLLHRIRTYSLEYVNICLCVGVLLLIGCASVSAHSMLSKEADGLFAQAIASKNDDGKYDLLSRALDKYSAVVNSDYGDVHSIVQMGRIYELQGNSRMAKSAFFRALNINTSSIDANYYLANFYYNNSEYIKALNYYRKALRLGKGTDFYLLCRLGVIYERLGDLRHAQDAYEQAFLMNPKTEFVADKIRELEDVKYSDTLYYKRSTKK